MVPGRVSDTKAIVRTLTQTIRFSHLSVASLLGVAGLLYALKSHRFHNLNIFSRRREDDDEDDDEDAILVPGLQNLGNNCFLNVILQVHADRVSLNSTLRVCFVIVNFDFFKGSRKLQRLSELSSMGYRWREWNSLRARRRWWTVSTYPCFVWFITRFCLSFYLEYNNNIKQFN